MRILVHEHVSGGGLAGEPLPDSLRREGEAMLRSIVADLARVNAVRSLAVTIDPRCGELRRELERGMVEILPIAPGGAPESLVELARGCDGAILIAPELEGAHERIAERIRASGARLLGASPAAVALAGDKLLLSRRLADLAVPAVPLEPADLEAGPPAEAKFPAVLKPRRGAGSQATWLVPTRQGAAGIYRTALAEGSAGEMVIGPRWPGLAASAAFLVGPERAWPLLAGEQLLSDDGRFRYRGGRIPLAGPLAARASALARRAIEAVPGLLGFAGVDLILERDPDPGRAPRDAVVEVNPRLSTSYLGLRELSRTNLAAAWLAAAEGDCPELSWREGEVLFSPDGRIERRSWD